MENNNEQNLSILLNNRYKGSIVRRIEEEEANLQDLSRQSQQISQLTVALDYLEKLSNNTNGNYVAQIKNEFDKLRNHERISSIGISVNSAKLILYIQLKPMEFQNIVEGKTDLLINQVLVCEIRDPARNIHREFSSNIRRVLDYMYEYIDDSGEINYDKFAEALQKPELFKITLKSIALHPDSFELTSTNYISDMIQEVKENNGSYIDLICSIIERLYSDENLYSFIRDQIANMHNRRLITSYENFVYNGMCSMSYTNDYNVPSFWISENTEIIDEIKESISLSDEIEEETENA